MASGRVCGIKVAGIAAAVPGFKRALIDERLAFTQDEIRKISEYTGILSRHIAPEGMCASDLCHCAAERLLDELGWSRDSVDALIFVSQTPDYILPATSCTLQHRLGLSKHCAAFDINQGCSGYIYGLFVVSQLLAGGIVKRALLLVGDTVNRIVSPQDRSAALLFGDAGTATALEMSPYAAPIFFELGTDGSGQKHLIVPAGAFRQPRSETTGLSTLRSDGNTRSDEHLYMDGAEIFTFTIREVVPLIQSIMAKANLTPDLVDALVMHQANQFILKYLTKRMRFPSEKVMSSIEDYGNTSSASIPLTIVRTLAEGLRRDNLRLVLAGFGVGFSWAAAALSCGPVIIPELIHLN
ncbi:MAG: 3-oxoacyl-ACP synthase III family protein [Syntrophobacteraceae bacterium]